jgi:hypothetical protein
MIAQQLENQLGEKQNDQSNEKLFTVERPHEFNTLMKTLRDALINSANGQEYVDNKPKPPSDSQETL